MPNNELKDLFVDVGASTEEVTRMKVGSGRPSSRAKMLELRSSGRSARRGTIGRERLYFLMIVFDSLSSIRIDI